MREQLSTSDNQSNGRILDLKTGTVRLHFNEDALNYDCDDGNIGENYDDVDNFGENIDDVDNFGENGNEVDNFVENNGDVDNFAENNDDADTFAGCR